MLCKVRLLKLLCKVGLLELRVKCLPKQEPGRLTPDSLTTVQLEDGQSTRQSGYVCYTGRRLERSSTFLCEVIVKETVNLVVDFAEKIPVKRIKRPACKLG